MAEEKVERREHSTKSNLYGGHGDLKFDYLLGDDDLAGRAKMYAKIKMEPGALLGFHEHKGETETYYIVSGEGVYFDGVKKEIAKPGDVFHCENNTGHSLENTGKDELEFIALILPA